MAIEKVTYDMPYNIYIKHQLYPGSQVELGGLIPEQSKGFEIQFVDGQHHRANKALYFKAVFEESPSLAVIKLGSFKNGQWMKEKKLRGPLRPGKRFLIQFVVTGDSYKIIANGQLLDEFPQYIPPKEVNFLEMDGEVLLEKRNIPPRHFTGR